MQTATEEIRCCHMGYSFRLAARVLLYASSLRQDNTYHGLRYTSCGALAGTRNSSMGPSHEGSIRRPMAPFEYCGAGSGSSEVRSHRCICFSAVFFMEIRDRYRCCIPVYIDGSRDGNYVACASLSIRHHNLHETD